MLKLIDFTYSDYYNCGSITVEYENRQWLLGVDTLDPSDDQQRLLKNIRCVTFIMHEEEFGWSESRNKHWVCYDPENLQFINNSDDDPVDSDEITFYDEAEWKEYHMARISEWVNDCEEIHDLIIATINNSIEIEKNELIFRLKFGSGTIILKPGVITDIHKACGGHCDYSTIIGERDGCAYYEEDILAVYDRYAIINVDLEESQLPRIYKVVAVYDDEAEQYDTYETFEEAVSAIEELQEETV